MKFADYKAGAVHTPVPCAGCGLMSDHWFPDGSPAWVEHIHGLPKPYYADDLVTLYHGDAKDIARTLPMPDVLVMDPPFDEWKDATRVAATTTIAFTSWQHRDAVHAMFGKPRAELVWAFADGRWVSHELPRITHETILVVEVCAILGCLLIIGALISANGGRVL